MSIRNKTFHSKLTTGFGEKSTAHAGRFYRKGGKANVERKGIRFFDKLSWYHTMLDLPGWKFWLWLLIPYIAINCLFGLIYFMVGIEHLNGVDKLGPWNNYLQCFFFSAQTYSTVGYGHVSPSGLLTSSIASFESFLGVLTLALASGLFYGRFSRPRSYLKFSEHALIAPYRDGIALMFRTVPFKNNQLMEAEVKLTLALKGNTKGEKKNSFFSLAVEFNKIDALILNWTIVHPINEESPLYGMNIQDLETEGAEVLVYLKAYDEVFANTVIARTSYIASEIVSGARFVPMYEPSPSGNHTILHLDRLDEFESVPIPALMRAEVE
jgi:inward rectifier potassium channel